MSAFANIQEEVNISQKVEKINTESFHFAAHFAQHDEILQQYIFVRYLHILDYLRMKFVVQYFSFEAKL